MVLGTLEVQKIVASIQKRGLKAVVVGYFEGPKNEWLPSSKNEGSKGHGFWVLSRSRKQRPLSNNYDLKVRMLGASEVQADHWLYVRTLG